MRLGILLFTPILLLAGVTLHAQEAVNAPEPAAAADSAANAELKAQLKAELLSEIRAELSSEVKTAVSKEADKPSRLTVGGVRRGRHDAQFLQRQLPALYQP